MVHDVFDRAMVAAADAFFLLPDAVWLDYLPASGGVRRIQAVLERAGAEETNGITGGEREAFEITVKNSATEGISSAEIDTGGDKLKLSPREAMPPITVSILEILEHDAAMLRIKAM